MSQKEIIMEELREQRRKLETMPTLQQAKKEVERIRMGLYDYFGSEERMEEMTFIEKKNMLYLVFNEPGMGIFL